MITSYWAADGHAVYSSLGAQKLVARNVILMLPADDIIGCTFLPEPRCHPGLGALPRSDRGHIGNIDSAATSKQDRLSIQE